MEKILIHSDGGARGNPGPAAIGVVVKTEDGEVLAKISEYIGETTNNIAEYTAVLQGLKRLKVMLKDKKLRGPFEWILDSELVVKQLAGEYKVKNPGLRPLFEEIRDLCVAFPNLTFKHVRREENKEADRLVNEALDKVQSK